MDNQEDNKQLSNEIITHFILKHSGPKQPITQAEYDELIKYYGTDRKGMPLKHNKIVIFSNIADIPEVEDYYKDNPEERPASKIKDFSTPVVEKLTPVGWKPHTSLKRFEELKNNLEANVAKYGNKMGEGTKRMIEHCNKKIDRLKNKINK